MSWCNNHVRPTVFKCQSWSLRYLSMLRFTLETCSVRSVCCCFSLVTELGSLTPRHCCSLGDAGDNEVHLWHDGEVHLPLCTGRGAVRTRGQVLPGSAHLHTFWAMCFACTGYKLNLPLRSKVSKIDRETGWGGAGHTMNTQGWHSNAMSFCHL